MMSKKPAHNMPTFIPPQFSAPPQDETNIKPSEYLKRISSNSALNVISATSSAATITTNLFPSSASTVSTAGGSMSSRSSQGSSRKFERANNGISSGASRYKLRQTARWGPEPGELIRSQSTSALSRIDSDSDLNAAVQRNTAASVVGDANDDDDNETKSSIGRMTTTSSNDDHDNGRSNQSANLMNAIRNFDRSKFAAQRSFSRDQLSSYSTKTTSTSDSTAATATPTPTEQRRGEQLADGLIAATKRDLIAELKETTTNGLERMKENCRSRCDVNKIVAAMAPSFKAEDFLDKVALNEPEAPLWRRQMLAKRAAERAKKEFEDRTRQEIEERRLSQVPAWKLQVLARKAAERQQGRQTTATATTTTGDHHQQADSPMKIVRQSEITMIRGRL